ncbi:hypothetical protein SeMB42_g04995 [Synchytrium endobioticum]|uniref:AD domain-containing protein n=1 Tax=Synchytrium endobioticum TaxID=286115 RepID=A0A507D8U3_9FUNG|nr:hypothetical protein SeMB42_g04995 [Synchytrium endobioticum]TPX47745.1 hypothetical protein SeLEV6574_g02481 [Synchytrium endobioticum]
MEGQWIRATSITGRIYEGLIFAFDEATKCLVLQSPSSSSSTTSTPPTSKYDFHLLKISYLKEICPTAPPPHIILPPSYNKNISPSNHTSHSSSLPNGALSPSTDIITNGKPNFSLAPIIPIPLDKLQQRESAAVRAEQVKQSRIGVNVSDEGQAMFDALIKTMQCRWKNDAIVVLDDVLIPPPYKLDSCRFVEGRKHDEVLLSRVKKVLDGERKRLGYQK